MRGGVDRAIRGGQVLPRNDGYDRYDARAGVSPRDVEFRGPLRGRDDYRPGRSPSPPRGAYRGRDEYGSSRNWDSYDGRERRRSRSRSPPYGRRDSGRYRERSLSPRVREANEDAELQIPRRAARDVPEVQIILMDELDRGFVGWVEGELRARGIRTEVMLLAPRISLQAVIRRQILEGVLAVAQLTRRSQDTSKIPLQVFDRTGGANNVRFDEYEDLEPKIAAELVLREKNKLASTAQPAYGLPQVAAPQYQQAPAVAAAPNLANLVGQLDNATLQKLLGTLNAVAPTPQVAPSTNPSLDLAGILGGLVQQQQSQQQQQLQQHGVYQPQQQTSNGYAAVPSADSLASIMSNMPSQAPNQGQSAQQVQNIMAQLAKFRQ
jgi:nuclear polyadenylated RNA-binding protein 3